MADPFQKLGISRTPAYELFGTPDVARGGFSNATRAAVDADRAALDEAQAIQDERDARARARQADRAVDEYKRLEPTARQKFFEEQGASMVGSKQYPEVENFQKAQPSFADRTLAKSIALKFEDPDARKLFQDEVARGQGTLAAQDAANTLLAKKQAAGELGKAGYSPDEAEALVRDRYDPAHVNYHIAKKKGETLFHKDPKAQAMERYYHTLKDQAALEAKDMTNPNFGGPREETAAEMQRVSQILGGMYKGLAEPAVPAVPAGAVAPVVPVPTSTPQAAPPAGTLLKDTLRSMNPAAPVGLPLESDEAVQQAKVAEMSNPENDENFYAGVIASPNNPLPVKQAALEKLRAYVQNPPRRAGDTIGAAMARRKALDKTLAQAEEDVEFHPVREQFSNDWQKSKNDMGEYVRRFANSLGVDEKEAIASLKENEELDIAAPGERPHYSRVRPLFENFVAKSLGIEKLRPFLRSTDERLSDYSNHKFASRLGVHPFSLPGFPNAGKTLALGQQPVSNEDVLNTYLEEATRGTPSSQTPPPQTAPKIEIGKPRKIQ